MSKLLCPKIWAGDLTLVPEGHPVSAVSSLHEALKDTGSGRVGDLVSCVNVNHSLSAAGFVNLLHAR